MHEEPHRKLGMHSSAVYSAQRGDVGSVHMGKGDAGHIHQTGGVVGQGGHGLQQPQGLDAVHRILQGLQPQLGLSTLLANDDDGDDGDIRDDDD